MNSKNRHLLLFALLGFGSAEATTTSFLISYAEYDEEGRVIREYGNNGQNVRYSYDGNGRLETTTDSLGRVTSFSHDELGRTTSITDHLGATTQYEYDKAD